MEAEGRAESTGQLTVSVTHDITSDCLNLHADWSVLPIAVGTCFAHHPCQLEGATVTKTQRRNNLGLFNQTVRKLDWLESSWDSYGEDSCLIMVKQIVKNTEC